MTCMKLALAGDTMLGRGVGERLATDAPASLFSPALVEVVREADLFVLNLECVISERGERWPDPSKPFFFRAPPSAVEALSHLGVDCVNLANNHALDFGVDALIDTFALLTDAGITWVGAGVDEAAAREAVTVERAGLQIGVVGVTDHPREFAARPERPGVAFADLRHGVPGWLLAEIARLEPETDAVLVTPHWGPNMVEEPVPHVRAAASLLERAGATLVAGHSAHVFHGVESTVLYDLGDFIDDYAIDPVLRNDLGLLFLVTIDGAGLPSRLEAVPLALEHCHTRLAADEEAQWIAARFGRLCAAFGTEVVERDGRLAVDLVAPSRPLDRAG